MSIRLPSTYQIGGFIADAIALSVFAVFYTALLPVVDVGLYGVGLGIVVIYLIALAFYGVLSALGIRDEWDANSKRGWVLIAGVYLVYYTAYVSGLYAAFAVVDPLSLTQVLWLAAILLLFPRLKVEADRTSITVKVALVG